MEAQYDQSHSSATFDGRMYYRKTNGRKVRFLSQAEGQMRSLHRDVYKSYWGAIPEGFVIHHVDGDGYNNEEINLEALSNEVHSSIHHIGKECSEEHRRKISEALEGRVFTEEHKRKIGDVRRGITGVKAPNWRGNNITPRALYMREYRAAKRAAEGGQS